MAGESVNPESVPVTSTGDDDRVEDPNPRFMQIAGTSANCLAALAQSQLSCDALPDLNEAASTTGFLPSLFATSTEGILHLSSPKQRMEQRS